MMRQVNLPKPTGEYAVGTFTYTVKDDREEALEPGTMRSVAARVYYPAEKESVQGFPKATALSDEMLKAFKRSFMAAPDFKKNPEANLSDCYPDAPKIPGKKFPLILFNPGYIPLHRSCVPRLCCHLHGTCSRGHVYGV